ncbi:hypothetical protein LCGC14_0403900 [marine sediment metagenome]|uniref:Uncharacterized protein n=1 Tax=marine sediment metagenome TaxID=412755 RepID=A0A0F9VHT9_9ZZZZ
MRKQTINTGIVNDVKRFLISMGKQVYDTGKCIYYVDYDNIPIKLTRI